MSPNGGGLAQWIEHFLNQGDEAKLRQIKEVYDKIKAVIGFSALIFFYLSNKCKCIIS
jgi:hypothetical protein